MRRVIFLLSLIIFASCQEGLPPPSPLDPVASPGLPSLTLSTENPNPVLDAGETGKSNGECVAKFFPFGIPQMISDGQLREEICDKKNKQMVDPLVCWHDCFSKKAEVIEGASEVLGKCWSTWVGKETPKTRDTWLDWFCSTNNSWVYKNMADHCLLHTLSEEFTNKTIWQSFKKCPAPGSYKFKWTFEEDGSSSSGAERLLSKIGKLFGVDSDTPARKKDLFAPPMTMVDAAIRIEMICKQNHEAMLKQQAHENDCFMRSHIDRKADVESCWSLMTGKESYPRDNNEWKAFMCEESDPFGVREGFEFCLIKRFQMTSHSECDQFHLFKTSYHIFRPELPASSVQKYHQLLKGHEIHERQMEKQKKLEERSRGVVNPWCSLIQKEGSIIVDSPSSRAFLAKNPLRCLYREGESEYTLVADLCIKFYAKLDNSSVSGDDFVIPTTDEQWLQFSCSLKDFDTSMKEMSLCIKQSVKRANGWIRATEILKKFNPGKAWRTNNSNKKERKLQNQGPRETSGSIRKFLKAVDFCLQN